MLVSFRFTYGVAWGFPGVVMDGENVGDVMGLELLCVLAVPDVAHVQARQNL